MIARGWAEGTFTGAICTGPGTPSQRAPRNQAKPQDLFVLVSLVDRVVNTQSRKRRC